MNIKALVLAMLPFLLAMAALAIAQDKWITDDGRPYHVTAQQQGPFQGAKNVVVSTYAGLDTLIFPGFVAYEWDGFVYNYACSVGFAVDTNLVASHYDRGMDSEYLNYPQFSAAESAYDGQPKLDTVTCRYVSAGSPFGWNVMVSGVRVVGLGPGTVEFTFCANP